MYRMNNIGFHLQVQEVSLFGYFYRNTKRRCPAHLFGERGNDVSRKVPHLPRSVSAGKRGGFRVLA